MFQKGQARLRESLKLERWSADALFFTDESQIGAPPHTQTPYAFKCYAFARAIEEGYDIALWLDCSVVCIKPIDPVFDAIEAKGHHFEMAGWSVGEWSTDACLEKLGITRDEGMKMPLYSAGMTGLDLRRDRSREFLRLWRQHADDGVSFIGPWRNDGTMSSDPRVLGHRHDQTVASALAHRLGMKLDEPTFFEYWVDKPPKPSTVALLKGI